LFPGARWAYVELAELHREWNQLEEAKKLLTIAFEMPNQINMLGGNIGIAYLVLASILYAEGDPTAAMDAVEQARGSFPETSTLHLWVDAVEARLHLALGNVPAAVQWMQTTQLPVDTATPREWTFHRQ
jgi:tetratricopeptide (TPR) repeat protein